MVSSSKYFSKAELRCRCGCDEALMDEKFMMRLDALRYRYNSPITLSSAYRCPKHNNAVSSTGLAGPHTTGKAVDMSVSGREAHKILELMYELNFQGVGVSQKGAHKSRFIHADDITEGNRPWVWTY